MTIIYNKRLGIIKCAFLGSNQHIGTVYGTEAEDYKLIYDEIEQEDDEFVFRNLPGFKINPETKKLEMIEGYIPRNI